MKKRFLPILILLLSLNGLAFAQDDPAKSGPELTFDQMEMEYGEAYNWDTVRKTFTFTNTGTEDLYISKVKPPCVCTSADWPEQAIKPGEKGEIQVEFRTEDQKVGQQDRTLAVFHNASDIPTRIRIIGTVIGVKPEDVNKGQTIEIKKDSAQTPWNNPWDF